MWRHDCSRTLIARDRPSVNDCGSSKRAEEPEQSQPQQPQRRALLGEVSRPARPRGRGSGEDGRDRERELEAERYRQAALQALDQLEWGIQYLHRLRKVSLAQTLARNRKTIIERGQLFR